MTAHNLSAELRGRDHALILLGIASALIILWLLLHRKASPIVNNETINQGGNIDFGVSPFPDLSLPPLTIGGFSYNVGGNTIDLGGGDALNVPGISYPNDNVGIENCGCGCSDDIIPTLLPGPVPTAIVTSPPAPREVVVVVPPPPKPHSTLVMGGGGATWFR